MNHMTTQVTNTPKSIDKAAADYQSLVDQLAEAKQELINNVQLLGTAPPRSDKSLRLEGIEWQITVSQGISTSIDQVKVEKLKALCNRLVFAKLFRVEKKFVLASNAADCAMSLPAALAKSFRGCITTKPGNPSLKVERRKSEVA
jgi:hypothetical protein